VGHDTGQETIRNTTKRHGYSRPVTVRSPTHIDENVWGKSVELRVLETPWKEPPEDVYSLDEITGKSAEQAGLR